MYSLSSFHSSPVSRLSFHSVLGGVESRGVLRKISDMLEVILKRMDSLSKLDNTSTTDARRLDELSSAINRYSMFFQFFLFFLQFLCVNGLLYSDHLSYVMSFINVYSDYILINTGLCYVFCLRNCICQYQSLINIQRFLPIKTLLPLLSV